MRKEFTALRPNSCKHRKEEEFSANLVKPIPPRKLLEKPDKKLKTPFSRSLKISRLQCKHQKKTKRQRAHKYATATFEIPYIILYYSHHVLYNKQNQAGVTSRKRRNCVASTPKEKEHLYVISSVVSSMNISI
ncbi:hypothetical protein A4A49_10210 [Nicotiana attenuata]|uniref:Uncharacterized protein n=1 Tax=Nicotiana attenuata TaxID=49451 RepID=A0A1J6I7Z5_NICAT|nr:hypothetical protein A4A49_10210 [Nicotiana attenuata]